MNAEQLYIIVDMKRKVKAVAERLESQVEENNRLKSANEELEQKLKQKQKKIEELEQKNSTIKLAKAFLAESPDAHEARLKINRIVREIDKCIALLNR
ncbi:MAG: hypothetical protein ACOYXB_15605 [Bacteroidota bacterium]